MEDDLEVKINKQTSLRQVQRAAGIQQEQFVQLAMRRSRLRRKPLGPVRTGQTYSMFIIGFRFSIHTFLTTILLAILENESTV